MLKVKTLYEPLQSQSNGAISLPRAYYRERKQTFYWLNDLQYKGNTVHVVACREEYY